MIEALNPKILGWANYHRHVVAKETFDSVDHQIWWVLWRWAERRHEDKPRRWIFDRYFGEVGNCRTAFKCWKTEENGKKRLLVLREASDVAIVRHRKILGVAQPFDPAFEEYFEQRLTLKMEQSLEGRRKLIYLWKMQQGKCPVCGEPITKITRWHVHHLVRRVDGGSELWTNLRLLHPVCHRQHHANPGLKWREPVEGNTLT